MKYTQILDKINKVFNSCNNDSQIKIAKTYSCMLVNLFLSDPDYIFHFRAKAMDILRYIDEISNAKYIELDKS